MIFDTNVQVGPIVCAHFGLEGRRGGGKSLDGKSQNEWAGAGEKKILKISIFVVRSDADSRRAGIIRLIDLGVESPASWCIIWK